MRRAFCFVLVCLALAVPGVAAAAPNDPAWYRQWNLKEIRSDRAWSVTKGSGVVVAVVDTGVDPNHQDLRGRLVGGHDFVDGDSTAEDANGHGTFMAGIVAAATGNAEGVASVAPSARIMPVRVLGAGGTGDPDVVAEGIRWAVSHGADVVNLSLATESLGDSGISPGNLFADPSMDAAIEDAARAGALVVIASGNDFDAGGRSQTAYSTSVGGVLVVGASTKDDRRAAYSNYGGGLDVLAPGGGSSSVADSCAVGSDIVSTWWDPERKVSDYGQGCGTSMAVAHVSGIGALLKARGYSNRAAADRIRSTATDLGAAGRDDQTGYGRVDAARAVGASSSAPPPPRRSTAAPKPKKSVGAAGSPKPTPPVRQTAPAPAASETPVLGRPLAAPPGDGPMDARTPLVGLASGLLVVLGAAHVLVRASLRSR